MMSSVTSALVFSQLPHKFPNIRKSQNLLAGGNFKRYRCLNPSAPQFETAPIAYTSEHKDTLPKNTPANIFETLNSPDNPMDIPIPMKTEHLTSKNLHHNLRTPLWLLGPTLLLLTGVVPTLWLPVSSIFPGPNMAGLLSLTGLDCIFNLGPFLFLLMADSAARAGTETCISRPPLDYRVFNVLANVTGLVVPLLAFLGSENGLGLLQPRMGMGLITFVVLLGPYLLLLSVQMLTELLTWHWGSPVWLVAPVVYEGYRLLQLMRAMGLGLGPDVSGPPWMVHTLRGLVCGWVLILGVQLMRVAWYAGFTASSYQQRHESKKS